MLQILIGKETFDLFWVGDRENGLSHLIVDAITLIDDVALCGVELIGASKMLAGGRPRCPMCKEDLKRRQGEAST